MASPNTRSSLGASSTSNTPPGTVISSSKDTTNNNHTNNTNNGNNAIHGSGVGGDAPIGKGLSLNETSSSYVEFGSVHFVITNGPSDDSLAAYLREWRAKGVSHLVRACEPNYATGTVTAAGISVHDCPWADGEYPPDDVVDRWLDLVFSCKEQAEKEGGKRVIAVHCVAGLGRAPVLCTIALIEQGMLPLEAIQFVRQRRRGALNTKQILQLEHYKRRRNRGACKGCSIQ